MNTSSRHHYIPKFLTKNFLDTDGLLFVYNKVENKINNKKQGPKSIFFEWDRNTVDFSGHQSDHLERLYSELDNKLSIDIKNILKTKRITPEELTSIVLLANQLKWRVPSIDKKFNLIKEDLTQKDLQIRINVKGGISGIDEKAIRDIENSNIFKESKRVLLSVLPFQKEEMLSSIYMNSFINTNQKFPALIGDSPVLERANTNIHAIEDFIFPLSSSDTFIFKKGTQKEINNILFYIQRDIATIHAAKFHVGCKSKEYLEKIIAMYNQMKSEGTLSYNNKFLFEWIS